MAFSSPHYNQPMLNRAMLEAVDFIHPEGWDCAPTLFALVPTELIPEHLTDADDSEPLSLVVQDHLPPTIEPGSEHLADYVSRAVWPEQVVGAVLAQEIIFKDTADDEHSAPRQARLFSGVLRGTDIEQTLLQLRPTEAELAQAGPFAADDVNLRGGNGIAPGVIAALRHGLERSEADLD